jgi:hypothetical protein
VTPSGSIVGEDGAPFDFFCGGDTYLLDGRLLSAGGSLAHDFVSRPDAVVFDPHNEPGCSRSMTPRSTPRARRLAPMPFG